MNKKEFLRGISNDSLLEEIGQRLKRGQRAINLIKEMKKRDLFGTKPDRKILKKPLADFDDLPLRVKKILLKPSAGKAGGKAPKTFGDLVEMGKEKLFYRARIGIQTLETLELWVEKYGFTLKE